MDEILLNDELDKEETKFIEQIKEIMEITNITTIELDNMINNYEFIKRIDYHEEFNYLIKYLKNNIIDFDLSDDDKNNIIQFLEKCCIEVNQNKEYKKYIKKINDFCEIIYNK